MVEDGFHFKFGNGTTNVWHEPWLLKDPLCHIVSFVHVQDTDLQIKDIITIKGVNLQNIYTMLPREIRYIISKTKIHIVDDVNDNWIWYHCASDVNSEKSAYSWLNREKTILLLLTYSCNWLWKFN